MGTDTEPDTDEVEETEPDTGEDLDTEVKKWKALARKHEAQAKKNAEAAKRLDELEDGNRTEIERATTKVTEAEKRAAKAESTALRLEVALDSAPDGMPVSKIRKLAKRLQGDSREELESDAEDLFAEFSPPDTGEEETGDEETEDAGEESSLRRRPTERLKPGASPDAEPEEDPGKIADRILNKSRI